MFLIRRRDHTGCFARPAGIADDRRRQGLDHGGGYGFQPIAPPVQRSAGGVQADRGPVVVDVKIEPDAGVSRVDGWASPLAGAKIIDDRIFQTQSGELGVGDVAVRDGCKDGECTCRGQEILPGNLECLLVKIPIGMAVESDQRGKDTICQTAVIINPVKGLSVRRKMNAPVGLPRLSAPSPRSSLSAISLISSGNWAK